MIYPRFIKENDTIGICAPSDGFTNLLKLNRLDNAHKNLERYGFKVKETNHVRTSNYGRSCSAKERAKEFMELINDKDISMILCATGGEFLLEILPYLDFQSIQENSKWIQGYSDPTGILYTLTTKYDIATIYSHNAGAFGMIPWHNSLKQNIDILKGNIPIQNSFDKYEKEGLIEETGLESYHLDTPVEWKSFSDEVNVKGRLIGGCLDIISELAGTSFDGTKDFINRYKDDGILWYFDNCELSGEDLIRTFWKLKDLHYFDYAKGILFGRSATESSYFGIEFKDTIKEALGELHIPIIYDMDFGHIPPRMTLINGSIATVNYNNKKGSINMECR